MRAGVSDVNVAKFGSFVSYFQSIWLWPQHFYFLYLLKSLNQVGYDVKHLKCNINSDYSEPATDCNRNRISSFNQHDVRRPKGISC